MIVSLSLPSHRPPTPHPPTEPFQYLRPMGVAYSTEYPTLVWTLTSALPQCRGTYKTSPGSCAQTRGFEPGAQPAEAADDDADDDEDVLAWGSISST